MKNIYDLFTSKARVKTLRTLFFQEEPIPLRHIACISDLPVFSVQNAIKPLLAENIIVRTEKDNNVLFALNRGNPLYNVLRQFFIIEAASRICMEAGTYYQKARQVLEFSDSAYAIFGHAKKGRLK